MHRPRRQPRRLDDNPQPMAEIPISTFYDREFKADLIFLLSSTKKTLKNVLRR